MILVLTLFLMTLKDLHHWDLLLTRIRSTKHVKCYDKFKIKIYFSRGKVNSCEVLIAVFGKINYALKRK